MHITLSLCQSYLNILKKSNPIFSSFFERTHSGLPTTCQNDHFLIEENTMEKHYAVFSLLIVAGGYFFFCKTNCL